MTQRITQRSGLRAALLAAALLAAALAPLAGLAAPAGDAARGAALYARCLACHAIEANRTGPQHCGLFGRRAGTAPGFDGYSAALQAAGIVWTESTLDRFLRDPPRVVPGTTMTYAGIADPRERADLIAWLRAATRPGSACTVQP